MTNLDQYDNSVIICPSEKKEFLISLFSVNPSLNIKYLSKKELMEGVYFSYAPDCIYYVSKKYGYSFENAREILDNMTGIKDGKGTIATVYKIYEDLFSSYKLEYSPYFPKLFDGKKVFIYGYPFSDKEIINALRKMKINYQMVDSLDKSYDHDYYCFRNINDEITFVFSEIGRLITSGVSLNDIVLYSLPAEYTLLIREQMKLYGIPFEDGEKVCLKDAAPFCEFINLLHESDKDKSFAVIREKFSSENACLNKIVQLDSEITDLNLDKEEYISFMSYLAKNIFLQGKKYDNAIRICSSSSYIGDKYCFMMGFSLGSYPSVSKDNDFFSDGEKEYLNRNTSSELNEMRKEELKKFISSSEHLIITFKEKVGKMVYYPSLLVKEMNLKKKDPALNNVRYSKKAAELEVGIYKDDFYNFASSSKYINTFSDDQMKYRTYSSSFKNASVFKEDDKISLSFSTIDDYVRCPFKYYLKKVMNASVFESNFNANLGTYFHEILEKSLSQDIRLEDFSTRFNELFVSPKERFFAHLCEGQVLRVIEKNRAFTAQSSLKTQKGETKVTLPLDDKTSLYGSIDKTMIDEKNKLVAIVDYKSYDMIFNMQKVEYGLCLQLPIYAMLTKTVLKDYKVCGLYYQRIIVKNPDDIKSKPYYLRGITLFNDDIIAEIDSSCTDSMFINGIKRKGGLIKKNTSLIGEEEFESILLKAQEKIKQVVSDIREGKFPICALQDNGEIPCTFCGCQDICFMNPKKDIIKREDAKNEETEEE